jgi:hypothetical protein
MDEDASANDTLHRRAPAGARKTGRNGAAAAEADPHEQAPLLWHGDHGGSDDYDDDEDEDQQNGGAEGRARGGADDGFDEWEGLPWYKKPSVGWSQLGDGAFWLLRFSLLYKLIFIPRVVASFSIPNFRC